MTGLPNSLWLCFKIDQLSDARLVTSPSHKYSQGDSMSSKKKSTNRSAKSPGVGTGEDADLQITESGNGYLIKGDITQSNAGLKDFATWNKQLGGWYISKKRAYEYDHHYGLRLFSK
jgi:hypothetical protein